MVFGELGIQLLNVLKSDFQFYKLKYDSYKSVVLLNLLDIVEVLIPSTPIKLFNVEGSIHHHYFKQKELNKNLFDHATIKPSSIFNKSYILLNGNCIIDRGFIH